MSRHAGVPRIARKCLAQQQDQAGMPHGRLQSALKRARQPVLWVPPTAPESAIERTRSDAERRARTTSVAIVDTVQNGTSDVLAERKHARRLAGLATPRTGIRGQGRKIRA